MTSKLNIFYHLGVASDTELPSSSSSTSSSSSPHLRHVAASDTDSESEISTPGGGLYENWSEPARSTQIHHNFNNFDNNNNNSAKFSDLNPPRKTCPNPPPPPPNRFGKILTNKN